MPIIDELIQIFENEWRDKQEIVKSVLRAKLGVTDRIFARKCNVVEISKLRHKEFMDKYHIQGGKGCNVVYGLEYNGDLVSVMSFNKYPKYKWEITRFANKLNMSVVGGASRLFKRFLTDKNPDYILTYADRRYSDGNLYKKLGFNFSKYTAPNYFYIKNKKVLSRQ